MRSIIPLSDDDGGGIVASDWMCTTISIGFSGELTATVVAEKGGAPEAGIVVDGFLCEISDPSCGDNTYRESWLQTLGDGGQTLTFVGYSNSSEFISYYADDDLNQGEEQRGEK